MRNGLDAANAGADKDADPVRVLPGNVESRVVHGLLARRHRVLRETVHAPHFAGIHKLTGIEVLDFTGNLGRETLGIEAADVRNAGRADTHRAP